MDMFYTGIFQPMLRIILFVLTMGPAQCRVQHGTQICDLISKNFSEMTRPVANEGLPVHVNMSIGMLSILEYNEISQFIRTSLYLALTWQHDFIRWTPSDHGKVKSIVVPQTGLWKPDVTIMNYNEERSDVTSDTSSKITIDSDGVIHWIPSRVFTSSCHLNPTHYPFDVQRCNIAFTSWNYNQKLLNLTASTIKGERAVVDLDLYNPNAEWNMSNVRIISGGYDYANETFSKIVVEIVLKRRPAVVVMNIIVPIIILLFLNIIVLKVPPEVTDKLGYAIVMVLSFYVFASSVSLTLPRNGENVAYLTMYLTFAVVMSSVIVCITAFTLSLSKRTGVAGSPRWLFMIIKFCGPRREAGAIPTKEVYRLQTTESAKPTTDPQIEPVNIRNVTDLNVLNQGDLDLNWSELASNVDHFFFNFCFLVILIGTVVFLGLIVDVGAFG